MNGTQAKVCLFVAIFKFKVALLDRVTQTVQTRLRSDRDYNTTGRVYMHGCLSANKKAICTAAMHIAFLLHAQPPCST